MLARPSLGWAVPSSVQVSLLATKYPASQMSNRKLPHIKLSSMRDMPTEAKCYVWLRLDVNWLRNKLSQRRDLRPVICSIWGEKLTQPQVEVELEPGNDFSSVPKTNLLSKMITMSSFQDFHQLWMHLTTEALYVFRHLKSQLPKDKSVYSKRFSILHWNKYPIIWSQTFADF